MAKGQTSIDLLLALLAAIVFMAVLNIYIGNLSQDAAQSSLRNSAKAILLDAYAATGEVKAYGLTIDYMPPQPAMPAPCSIEFDNDNSDAKTGLKVSLGGETAGYSGINFDDIKIGGSSLAGNNTATKPCNEKFTIGKA